MLIFLGSVSAFNQAYVKVVWFAPGTVDLRRSGPYPLHRRKALLPGMTLYVMIFIVGLAGRARDPTLPVSSSQTASMAIVNLVALNSRSERPFNLKMIDGVLIYQM
jgi:hypothetical protein